MKIYHLNLYSFKRHLFIKFLLVVFFIFSGNFCLWAQDSDTVYYETFHDQVHYRLYTSRKYTSFVLNEISSNQRFRFEPNSSQNLGLGVTYKGFTLNLAYGFGFMNELKQNVPTRYLDLQAHLYPKNLVIDFFGQFYKGYYLQDKFLGDFQGDFAYSEMNLKKLGFNLQYLFNGDKLSLRASFLQNERQLKSAGSFLLGLEMYNAQISDINFLVSNISFDSQRSFQIGPNAGYAYTLVFLKNFFVTTVISSQIGIGHSQMGLSGEQFGQWFLQPSLFGRGFLGYQHPRWSLNLNYVHNRLFLGPNNGFSNELMTGNYRLNFVYRLSKNSRTQQTFDRFINKIISVK
jgi:hypothetical protein